MGEAQAKPGIERWLSTVALVTFIYYLVTFAFEVGFFWRVGLQYLPTFSASEHTLHAAAYIIGTFGAVVFAALAFGIPQAVIGISVGVAGGPPTQAEPPTRKTMIVSWLMRAPGLGIMGWILYEGITDIATDGPNPGNLFMPLAALTMLAWMLDGAKGLIKHAWVWPGALLLILSPFSLGYVVHYSAANAREGTTILNLEKGTLHATPIFVGTERGLYQTKDQLLLVAADGRIIMQVVPRADHTSGTALPPAPANR